MAVEVTEVREPLVKSRVRLPTTPSIRRSVKLTTPLTVVRERVPISVPAPAAVMLAVTDTLGEVHTLPKASRSPMTGCWVKATPAVAVADGWVLIASAVASPAVTLKLALLTPVSPGAEKSSVLAPISPSIRRLLKVATPPVVLAVLVPIRVPAPVPTTAVMVTPLAATSFPNPSCTSTAGWVVNAIPARAPAGSVTMASLAAGPAVMVTVPPATAG